MSPLQHAILNMLWSAWSELGVPGKKGRHLNVALDLEPLIAWTPQLAVDDPRLLSAAFDWCAINGELASKVRITGLARNFPESARGALASFSAALKKHGIEWQPSAKPSALSKTRENMAVPMRRPSLARLRIRTLSGSSVRGDVLASLLAVQHAASVGELVPPGFTKRSVERVLNELTEAGFVLKEGADRRRRFRLAHPKVLEQLVNSRNLRWPNWQSTLALAFELTELENVGTKTNATIQRVEAARRFNKLNQAAVSMALPLPPGPQDRDDIFAALLGWGVQVFNR